MPRETDAEMAHVIAQIHDVLESSTLPVDLRASGVMTVALDYYVRMQLPKYIISGIFFSSLEQTRQRFKRSLN